MDRGSDIAALYPGDENLNIFKDLLVVDHGQVVLVHFLDPLLLLDDESLLVLDFLLNLFEEQVGGLLLLILDC